MEKGREGEANSIPAALHTRTRAIDEAIERGNSRTVGVDERAERIAEAAGGMYTNRSVWVAGMHVGNAVGEVWTTAVGMTVELMAACR